jgi:hypothetical protein
MLKAGGVFIEHTPNDGTREATVWLDEDTQTLLCAPSKLHEPTMKLAAQKVTVAEGGGSHAIDSASDARMFSLEGPGVSLVLEVTPCSSPRTLHWIRGHRPWTDTAPSRTTCYSLVFVGGSLHSFFGDPMALWVCGGSAAGAVDGQRAGAGQLGGAVPVDAAAGEHGAATDAAGEFGAAAVGSREQGWQREIEAAFSALIQAFIASLAAAGAHVGTLWWQWRHLAALHCNPLTTLRFTVGVGL